MVYNLNTGKNDELLERCRPLKEYMIFINKVREYSDDKGVDIKTAITKAIDYCIEENIMREFLIKHKAEVFSVCITEFDEKIYEAELREEAREEGLKEGREGERAKNILTTVSILRGLGLDDSTIVQQISEKFELTPLEIDRYFDKVLKGLDRSNSKC